MSEVDADGSAAAVWAWREAGLTVRTVRGRKMRDLNGLFDEMAAALQFPDYFGENWPAFDECLADMEWLPMNVGIVIVVLNPGEVLVDAPDVELNVLVRMISHAAETYAQPIESGEWWDRPAVPFHVVLHAEPTEAAAVRERWQAAGAQLSELTG
jgi:RNAse (barnase) inhibitor barstar